MVSGEKCEMKTSWPLTPILLLMVGCATTPPTYHDGARCYSMLGGNWRCIDSEGDAEIVAKPDGRRVRRSFEQKLNDYWKGKTVLDIETDSNLSIRMNKQQTLSDGQTLRWMFLIPVKGETCDTSETGRSRWARALTAFSNGMNNTVDCTTNADHVQCRMPQQTPIPAAQLETSCVPSVIQYITFIIRNETIVRVTFFQE